MNIYEQRYKSERKYMTNAPQHLEKQALANIHGKGWFNIYWLRYCSILSFTLTRHLHNHTLLPFMLTYGKRSPIILTQAFWLKSFTVCWLLDILNYTSVSWDSRYSKLIVSSIQLHMTMKQYVSWPRRLIFCIAFHLSKTSC